MRSSSNRKHTTVREHMPSSHRRYADWTPEHLRRRAGEIGPNTSALVEIILRERPHPEQGFRSSIGIIGLAEAHGRERLEAACGSDVRHMGRGTIRTSKAPLGSHGTTPLRP